MFYNNSTPFEVRNRILILLLTGNIDDIPLYVSVFVVQDGSMPFKVIQRKRPVTLILKKTSWDLLPMNCA